MLNLPQECCWFVATVAWLKPKNSMQQVLKTIDIDVVHLRFRRRIVNFSNIGAGCVYQSPKQ
jgi:hypothetical protein